MEACPTLLRAVLPTCLDKGSSSMGELIEEPPRIHLACSELDAGGASRATLPEVLCDRCPLCVELQELLVHETWAGTLHSACLHGACRECLRMWIFSQLYHCRAEGQLRVPCFAPGCTKVLPQTLTFHACPEAASWKPPLAPVAPVVIDAEEWAYKVEASFVRNLVAHHACPVVVRAEAACGLCGAGRRAAVLMSEVCGHCACVECWAQSAEAQLAHCPAGQPLCAECPEPGCVAALPRSLLRGVLVRYSNALLFLVALFDLEVKRNEVKRQHVRLPAGLQVSFFQACEVCREVVPAALANPGCGHTACEGCWRGWLESQAIASPEERCARVRSWAASGPRCFGPGCRAELGGPLKGHLCQLSAPLEAFDSHLARRRQLTASPFFPSELQAECPSLDCWGLGYLGHDTVMCFVCERQWEPAEPGVDPSSFGIEEVMGLVVKRCPRCQEYIEKRGGCDHMTCRCRYEFYWSTMKPYR